MVLSIGMIVKNEAENLERCLKSLEPVRNAVQSELIIVDTGSTDSTVEIAGKYADKVLHFEWCKDFSAARNVSLEASSGEWFMFVDADEWFGDSGGLIDFFKSGEYRKYNSAVYIQRNYTTKDINGHYIDYTALRLTKRLMNTRFVNPVHEYLNTAGEPIKLLNSFVHHFGYVNLNPGDHENKRKRNLELIEKRIAEKDDDVSPYIQLFDSYFGFDNAKAAECCRRGIEINKKYKVNKYAEFVLLKLCALAWYNEKKYEKALEVINEYRRLRNDSRNIEDFIVTDLEIAALSVYTYLKLEMKEAVRDECGKYNELYKTYKKGKYNIAEVLLCAPRFTGNEEFVNINIIFIGSLIEAGKFSTAYEKRNAVPYNTVIKHTGYRYVSKLIGYDFEIAKGTGKYSIIKTLFGQIKDFDECLRMFEYNLIKAVGENDNTDEKAELINYAYNFINEYSPPYNFIKFVEMNKMYYCGNGFDVHEVINFISEFKILPVYSAGLLYFSLKSGNAVSPVISKINPYGFKEYYDNISDKKDFLRVLIQYLEDAGGIPFKEQVWFIAVIRFLFSAVKESRDVYDLFVLYAALQKNYIYTAVNPEYINDGMIVSLPDSDKAAYYCFRAAENLKSMDGEKAMDYLKKALRTDNSLRNVYPAAAEIFGEGYRAKMYPAGLSAYEAEIDILGSQIKEKIRGMIYIGYNAMASKLLLDYSELNPGDPEINALSSEVNALTADR